MEGWLIIALIFWIVSSVSKKKKQAQQANRRRAEEGQAPSSPAAGREQPKRAEAPRAGLAAHPGEHLVEERRDDENQRGNLKAANQGDAPHAALFRRPFRNFRERDRRFDRPARTRFRLRDKDARIPVRIVPVGIVQPAPAVKYEFVGGRIIAVEIDLNFNAVVCAEVVVAIARRLVFRGVSALVGDGVERVGQGCGRAGVAARIDETVRFLAGCRNIEIFGIVSEHDFGPDLFRKGAVLFAP